MEDHDIEKLLDNEKEWRRYMIKKVDKMDDSLNNFKIKTISFFTVITVALNAISHYLK